MSDTERTQVPDQRSDVLKRSLSQGTVCRDSGVDQLIGPEILQCSVVSVGVCTND